jgi:hypothetical protein
MMGIGRRAFHSDAVVRAFFALRVVTFAMLFGGGTM